MGAAPNEELARLKEQVALQEKEIALLLDVSRQIVTLLDIEQVLSLVADRAMELIQAESLLIPIINKTTTHYLYQATSGKNADLIKGQQFPIHVGMCGWVLTHERPLMFGRDYPWEMDEKTRWEEGKESALLVPLIARGRIIGGLSGIGRAGGGSFTQRDLELLMLFANQVSVAIENAQVFRELETEKEMAEITLHSIADGVIRTDARGIVQYLNPVAEFLTGWKRNSAVGQHADQLLPPMISEERAVSSVVTRCLENRETVVESDYEFLPKGLEERLIVQLSASPLHSSDAELSGTVLIFRDITQAQEIATTMAYQASHDALTGLFNRAVFEERLEQLISESRENDAEHTLLYLDLDQFKIVNDTCGHLAGDELLRQISGEMKEQLRHDDLLARLGGDEFGLLLAHCDEQCGARIAETLKDAISDFRFVWKEKSFFIGVSIGVVPITRHAGNYTSLLVAADRACYAAKDRGRNRIHLYREEDVDLNRRHGEMEWVHQISQAMMEDRFVLFAQPIRPLQAQDQKARHELLLRIRSESGELTPPGAFIPAAERYDKMTEIDRWVVATAISKIGSSRALTAMESEVRAVSPR
ncbi:diguanylate cyclase domain-containing protein [Candidatus Reidiella endopervernicosa]|uniref:Diguanylate cyclase n=1 Tax=Candidatus Reidiella endopervernicosa TaxID=2738883 RepID=A0A6N0HTW7_9GAMM|nr:diguanylate cyclase [Candidatus Reidiella endopervernicosa]QKQ25853.1 diguanylate cyclase [Candidatus Reidiella endopervernicosa]